MNYQTFKPRVFLVVLLLLFGGGMFHYMDAVYFYIPFYVAGFSLLLYIFFHTWCFYYPSRHEAEAEKFKQYRLLTLEQRAELGYIQSPDSMKVQINTVNDEGGITRAKFDLIPGTPVKIKTFFAGVLGGRPIRHREWTPQSEGKLFSRNEYEKLIAKLIELGYLEKIGESDSATLDVTDLGLMALFDYLVAADESIKTDIDPDFYYRLIDLGRIKNFHLDQDQDQDQTIQQDESETVI